MSAPPRAPGIARPAIQSHLLELLPTAIPERMVTAMLTSPEGMLSRAAVGGLYPKFLISVAEYVVMTPLEIEHCKRAKNNNNNNMRQPVLHLTRMP